MNTNIATDWIYQDRQLDQGVLWGAVITLVLVALVLISSGSSGTYFNIGGLLIVLGGTLSATLVNFSLDELKAAWLALQDVILAAPNRSEERIQDLVRMAHSVRRNGLLVLEKESQRTRDRFLRMALEITVDGQPAEDLKRILETDIRSSTDRTGRAVQVFQTMGGYAPAMGLIGTLIGLVRMLGSLNDPAKVGPAMAIALLTTLYGAVLANLFLLPIAGKIKNRAEQETLIKSITVEGAVSLGKQENPIVLEQRLQGFLPLVPQD